MERIAKVLADRVYQSESQLSYETYQYGLQVALERLAAIIAICCVAITLDMKLECCLFLLIFSVLRSYVGGLHFSGFPVAEEREIQHVQYRLRQNIEKILHLQYNQSILGISEADILGYELKEVKEYYVLGDRVRFKGICLIIAEISSYLSSNTGIFLRNYLLVTKGASRQKRIYNPAMKG